MARNRSDRPGESEISPGYEKKEEKMRPGHFGIALLAAAALLPAAVCCVKIDDTRQEGDVAISYNTVLEQPRTKAATAYREDVPFKSYAWYLPNGKTWRNDKANAVPYFADATISFDTGSSVWRDASNHYYWPKAGSLSFRSYSPASIPVAGATSADGISVTKDGVTLTNWQLNGTTHQDIDFMVADLTSDRAANATTYGYLGVPTLFRHKLAKLTVQASSGSVPTAGQEPKIYKISLKYIFTKGSYTPAAEAAAGGTATPEAWGSKSAMEEIVIFEDSAGQTINTTAYNFTGAVGLLVIPQVLNTYVATADSRTVAASIYVEYAYYDTATGGYPSTPSSAEKTFEGIKSYFWAIGHHYTYSLVIGEENEPIEFDAGVADWADGGSYTINIGGE